MARMKGDSWSGGIGPVIFYEVNGQKRIRSKPDKKRKRRKEEPANAPVPAFTAVSRGGSPMINLMKEQRLFPFATDTYSKTRGWMIKHYAKYALEAEWPVCSEQTPMYQLNKACDLRNILLVTPVVKTGPDQTVIVQFPAFNPAKKLITPSTCKSAVIAVTVLYSEFKNKNDEVCFKREEFEFSTGKQELPAKEMQFSDIGNEGDTILVMMTIRFKTSTNQDSPFLNDPAWQPAAILAMGRF